MACSAFWLAQSLSYIADTQTRSTPVSLSRGYFPIATYPTSPISRIPHVQTPSGWEISYSKYKPCGILHGPGNPHAVRELATPRPRPKSKAPPTPPPSPPAATAAIRPLHRPRPPFKPTLAPYPIPLSPICRRVEFYGLDNRLKAWELAWRKTMRAPDVVARHGGALRFPIR